MVRRKERTFGQVIRERRRELNLTQREVARRVNVSIAYIGHLEADKRHPSDKILGRLTEVLRMERRDLYFIANPHAIRMLQPDDNSRYQSAWDELRRDNGLRRSHRIKKDEMELLERVAAMGKIPGTRDFIYILNTIRYALGR
ncbi:helix-turn-helix transcriptional regulator [bacterium]|nr:helix-turn-helix transcriptional regulator [bacterium]